MGPARAEQRLELRAEGDVGVGVEGEVGQAQLEAAVGLLLQQPCELVLEPGLAEGGQAHHLVLALVDLETQKGCQRGVEQADRMGVFDGAQAGDAAAVPLPDGGGHVLPHTVDGQDGRLVIGAGEEGAGRVAAVVGGGGDLAAGHVEHRGDTVQNPDLRAELGAHRAGELLPGMGEGPKRSQDHSLQAGEGILVEHHPVQILGGQASLGEAAQGGVLGQARIVLAAGEALLLHGRDDLAVDDQGGGGVVIIGRDSQHRAHGRSRTRSQGRAFGMDWKRNSTPPANRRPLIPQLPIRGSSATAARSSVSCSISGTDQPLRAGLAAAAISVNGASRA